MDFWIDFELLSAKFVQPEIKLPIERKSEFVLIPVAVPDSYNKLQSNGSLAYWNWTHNIANGVGVHKI